MVGGNLDIEYPQSWSSTLTTTPQCPQYLLHWLWLIDERLTPPSHRSAQQTLQLTNQLLFRSNGCFSGNDAGTKYGSFWKTPVEWNLYSSFQENIYSWFSLDFKAINQLVNVWKGRWWGRGTGGNRQDQLKNIISLVFQKSEKMNTKMQSIIKEKFFPPQYFLAVPVEETRHAQHSICFSTQFYSSPSVLTLLVGESIRQALGVALRKRKSLACTVAFHNCWRLQAVG